MNQEFERIMSKQNLYLQSINELPLKKNPFLTIIFPQQVTVKNRKAYHESSGTQIYSLIQKNSQNDLSKNKAIINEKRSFHKKLQRKNNAKSQNQDALIPKNKENLLIKGVNLNSPKFYNHYFSNVEQIQEKVQEQLTNILAEINLNDSTQTRLICQQNFKDHKNQNQIIKNLYRKNYLYQDSIHDQDSEDLDDLSTVITCENQRKAQYFEHQKVFGIEKLKLTRQFKSHQTFHLNQ